MLQKPTGVKKRRKNKETTKQKSKIEDKHRQFLSSTNTRHLKTVHSSYNMSDIGVHGRKPL
jgi:hypothetical protein